MALSQSALSELLDAIRAGGSEDVIREAMAVVLQELIELEASQAIGAGRYERSDGRTNQRNGSRARLLSTKAGDVELRIPKLRSGSFFPALLEPRRRIDRALWVVVMEACVHGVSTRKVDDLVKALGIDAGISKSEVSRICAELDEVVGAFRDRPLGHISFPYVFLDATYVKAHDGPSVVAKAIVIATGVTRNGDREVLGLAVGDSEDGAIWTAFLGSLRARGLGGAIRTIFAQPDSQAVAEQFDEIVARLEPRFPQVAAMLAAARDDLVAFTAFPVSHWRKIWSTNPLERVNKEVKRRSDVVGIFPDEGGVLRLAGTVLLEIHDEWAIAERRYLSEASMALLDPARA